MDLDYNSLTIKITLDLLTRSDKDNDTIVNQFYITSLTPTTMTVKQTGCKQREKNVKVELSVSKFLRIPMGKCVKITKIKTS